MTDAWDATGYIASSRYRLAVCEYLTEYGPGLPSEIAVETDLAQPHVSRALSELRERDVVELLVPETQQKGRLYDLTSRGRVALNQLSRGRNTIDVQVVDQAEFPCDDVVEFLFEEYGDDVTAVAQYDGEVADVHCFGSPPAECSESPIIQLWEATEPNGELTPMDGDSHEFTVYGLESVTLVEVLLEEERRLGVSLRESADVTVRAFVERLETRLYA